MNFFLRRKINYSIIIPHKNTSDLLQYCQDLVPIRDDVRMIVVVAHDKSFYGIIELGNTIPSFFFTIMVAQLMEGQLLVFRDAFPEGQESICDRF